VFLKEIELAEVCDQLPTIQRYDPQLDSTEDPDQMFICACGFEDRSIAIPSRLSESGKYKTRYSLLFEHETNREDNAINRPRLTQCLDSISETKTGSLTYRDEDFVSMFDSVLDRLILSGEELPRVSFDISACSGKMILSALKLLFERRIRLRLLYAEAAIYHPTPSEYERSPQDWTVDGEGMSKGILKANESCLYPSLNLRELPILLVAFPTFKPERMRSIRAELQPAQIFWIIGIPHAPENQWRTSAMREINEIPGDQRTYEISTFNYVDTFSLLEQIYSSNEESYHMIVAPHGSKLQNVGIAMFCLLRQDVGLWLSTPESFNPAQYTSGVKGFWQIDFGDIQQIIKAVRLCGKIELKLP